MDQWLPQVEGKTARDKVARDPLQPLVYSTTDTMQTLAQTGVWFTYAACLTRLPIPSDPLADFLSRRPELQVGIMVEKMPLFRGLQASDARWNHAAFWIACEQWPWIRDHLSACVFRWQSRNIHTAWLETVVPDVLQLRQRAVLPACCVAPLQFLSLLEPGGRLQATPAGQPWLPTCIERVENEGDVFLPRPV